MAKVIDSCRSCGFLAYDLGFKPFCGETGTYIDDIYNGIPADCPLPDAPDATSVKQLEANCRWLIARIDEIHAAAYPGKTGTWQERAEQAVEAVKKLRTEIDDEYALYESLSEMHEAAKKDWWAEREKLQAENDRLRELLDKALEEHIENALTFCPDGCWCREAERVLEGTK
jgi:hypothetical protein